MPYLMICIYFCILHLFFSFYQALKVARCWLHLSDVPTFPSLVHVTERSTLIGGREVRRWYPIAETTTTTSWPAFLVSTMRSATRRDPLGVTHRGSAVLLHQPLSSFCPPLPSARCRISSPGRWFASIRIRAARRTLFHRAPGKSAWQCNNRSVATSPPAPGEHPGTYPPADRRPVESARA